METNTEQKIHLSFHLVLLVKLVIAVFQVLGGSLAYLITVGGNVFARFISPQAVLDYIQVISLQELVEDPRDFLATYLLHFAQTFSISTLHFVAFYLVAHGLIKLWLIIGLFRRKLWYYPVSIVVFCFFMFYQLYRYTFTHSKMLIFLSVVDVFVIGLTWREYKNLRSLPARDSA